MTGLKNKTKHSPPLTLGAVLSLPARVADDLAALAAGEVAEGVVARPAEDGAAVAVVVLVAQEAVGVAQLGAAAGLHVLGPLVSHCEVALGGDPADQTLRVVCTGHTLGLSVKDDL